MILNFTYFLKILINEKPNKRDLEERNLRMIESYQNSEDNLEETMKHFKIISKRKDKELKNMDYQRNLIESSLERRIQRSNG